MRKREEQQDALQNIIEELVEASVDLAVFRYGDPDRFGADRYEKAVTDAERELGNLIIDIFGADDEIQS